MSSRILIWRKWSVISKKYLNLQGRTKWWEASLRDSTRISRNSSIKNINQLMKPKICSSIPIYCLKQSNTVLAMGLILLNLTKDDRNNKFENKSKNRNQQHIKLQNQFNNSKNLKNLLLPNPKLPKLKILSRSMRCQIVRNQQDIFNLFQRRNHR